MPDAITAALAKHLCGPDWCSSPPCPDHLTAAGSALQWLANAGLILPAGITIGAVYRVRQDPGYSFTDRLEAERWARDGGSNGRHGDVETAWRIQGDGVDVTTAWKPAPPPDNVAAQIADSFYEDDEPAAAAMHQPDPRKDAT